MLDENRLLPFIFTFLPALVYACIVYLSAPYKSINFRFSQLYFMLGLVSAMVTSWVLWIFPHWQDPMLTQNIFVSQFVLAFIQIALLEEGVKYLMFRVSERYRIKKCHPGGLMFYCMSVSAGFAVLENMMYLQIYGNDVLVVRAFSAIILHMLTGLMMGYFITIGKMRSTSVWGRLKFGMLGLLTATFYHGIYDYNIFLSQFGLGIENMYMLLPGAAITFLMWGHLMKKYLKKIA